MYFVDVVVIVLALSVLGALRLAYGYWQSGVRAAKSGRDHLPPYAPWSWRATWWRGGYSSVINVRALDRMRRDRERLSDHLVAFAGDAQAVAALTASEPPSPRAALRIAEETYLVRTGWQSTEDESWSPSWAPETTWSRSKAIDRQRSRDSVPPGALAELRDVQEGTTR